MKFFHLSDLHIGLKLINRDLKEDQEYILDEIIRIAVSEQPDAVVIAGDIYDKSIPSAEAVEVFDRFLSRLSESLPEMKIMMISGNHDSAARLNLYRSLLKSRNVYMIGTPPMREGESIEKLTLQDAFGPVNFYLLPFVKPSMVKAIVGTDENGNNLTYDETVTRLLDKETVDEQERNVLVSHQFYLPSGTDSEKVERMESELTTIGDIDKVNADILKRFDYAALGHIHKPMKAGSEFHRYCGTPLACSVSEAGQQKSILAVEMKEKGDLQVRQIPLEPLRQVKVLKGTVEEVLGQACDDYVTVVLTEKTDLDVIDMQDRLRHAFPNLLEIRREALEKAEFRKHFDVEEIPDTFTLCSRFLNSSDEEELELLKDVIHTVLGAN